MTQPRICVVAYYRARRPDAVLAEVARRLSGSDVRVGGCSRHAGSGPARCARLFLRDVASGRRVEIFERRGVVPVATA